MAELHNFIAATDRVVVFESKFTSDSQTLGSLNRYSSRLQELFEDVENTYQAAISALETDEERASIIDKYETVFGIFATLQGKIEQLIADLTPQQSSSSLPIEIPKPSAINRAVETIEHSASNQSPQIPKLSADNNQDTSLPRLFESTGFSVGDLYTHSMAVPPCEIPNFHGTYESWPTFRDLFEAVFVRNSRLSDVERLFHLLHRTSGDAKAIIQRFPLTNAGFNLAWSLLASTYENKRVLVNSQLRKLFSLAAIVQESAQAIKKLRGEINSCIETLKLHHVSIENWDPILVFLCSQRLPASTIELWEQNLLVKNSLPPWSELDSFLADRILTLEAISETRTSSLVQKPSATTNKSAKLHLSRSPSTSQSQDIKKSCPLCVNTSHNIRGCKKFRAMNTQERWNCVKRNNLCANCLSSAHSISDCNSVHTCSVCTQRHHSWLHNYQKTNKNSIPAASSNLASSSSQASCSSPSTNTPKSFHQCERKPSTSIGHKTVLLGTATVYLHYNGDVFPARALLDSGSEVSFISASLRQKLRLPMQSTTISLLGVNSQVTATSSKLCSLSVGPIHDQSVRIECAAYVLPKISGNLPSFTIDWLEDASSTLSSIPLADKHFYQSSVVDILLGADVYPDIIRSGVRHDILGSLVAQETAFGWVLTGKVDSQKRNQASASIHFASTNVDDQLRQFWEIEEIPKKKYLSTEDKFCENLYRTTTSRNAEGRYIVHLPFRPMYSLENALGDSRTSALSIFRRNESSLVRKPHFKPVYDGVIKEYLDLDHMVQVSSPTKDEMHKTFYLPHHPVIKPDSTTTKVRVVFNASHVSANGRSLNDILYPGPALQSDLTILLLQWRLYKYVFSSDITKMYRQILISPDQCKFQRILFRDNPQESIKDFQLHTVTFGVNCAPFLAIRTLHQLADDVQESLPLASTLLRSNMYVGDVLAGYDDIQTALSARNQLIAALNSAGFQLRKWSANDRTLIADLPPSHLLTEDFLQFEESSSSKALGVRWNAVKDEFYFIAQSIKWKTTFTKREVLSIIASLFDPAGWLAPIVVVAKMLMQQIWLDGTGWDESLIPSSLAKWKEFVDNYPIVSKIRIPRWVGTSKCAKIELHGFCDASEKAYAAVLYVRVDVNNQITTYLVTAKTRVAPVKTISLPRLELCGALLLAQMIDHFKSETTLPQHSLFCWTDSTIVLAWLQKPPCAWQTFVASRVSKIQDLVGVNCWRHISGLENPADVGSRGICSVDFITHELWWTGPKWLSLDQSQWPTSEAAMVTMEEAKPVKTHVVTTCGSIDAILDKFPCFARALRILSYFRRFIYATRKWQTWSSRELTAQEMTETKHFFIKCTQKEYFAAEYALLKAKKPIKSKSPLVPLNPMLDEHGLLRINGRLTQAAGLSYSERYPIILPYQARFSRLLVKFIHDISLHGGNRLMLRLVRQEFWIPRAQNLIKHTIHQCKTCILYKQKQQTQLMAALPAERCTYSRPFSVTGVDYAGPFEIKNYTGRACLITKGYVCVFVCFSHKAIHLELTNNMTSDSFLAAFARFVSRRGCPRKMVSDNGTTFVGASASLRREFKRVIKDSADLAQRHYAHQGLTWEFIPAGAPHMGGLWEAGVKSFKTHFKKVASNFKYTFEEMTTLLCRIEACLNSRPLCLNGDTNLDSPSLTPSHLLGGFSLLSPAEDMEADQPISIRNRWRRIKALSQQFALRWKEEYLKELHKRNKWRFPSKNIEVGDAVVIRQENLPPTEWRLGRVELIHPGSDQRVRVATIHTLKGKVTRPLAKLVLLPKDDN